MSVRTKAMTHFHTAVTGAVDAQILYNKAAEGLAGSLYAGVKELSIEFGLGAPLLAEFDKAMIDEESNVRSKLPDGVSLSEFCPAFRSRKSALRSAIKAGIDPSKYESYSKFTKAAKKLKDEKDGKLVGGATGGGYTPHDNTGGVDGGATSHAKIAEYTGTMPDKARAKLKAYTADLEALFKADESAGYAALTVATTCAHDKLKAVGGRLSNVSKKTA